MVKQTSIAIWRESQKIKVNTVIMSLALYISCDFLISAAIFVVFFLLILTNIKQKI